MDDEKRIAEILQAIGSRSTVRMSIHKTKLRTLFSEKKSTLPSFELNEDDLDSVTGGIAVESKKNSNER